jgi:hypothetical protein
MRSKTHGKPILGFSRRGAMFRLANLARACSAFYDGPTSKIASACSVFRSAMQRLAFCSGDFRGLVFRQKQA